MGENEKQNSPAALSEQQQEVRNRVLTTAARLMKQRGIKPLTMSEIAVECGVSKRTIYELFEDKTAVVKAVMLENFAGYPPEWVRELENPLERLIAAMLWGTKEFFAFNRQFFCDMQRCYPPVWEEYAEKVRRGRLEKTEALLRRGEAEGLFRPGLDYPLVARFLLGAEHLIGNQETFPPEEFSLEYVSWEFEQLFVRGIATEKGKETLETYLAQHAPQHVLPKMIRR